MARPALTVKFGGEELLGSDWADEVGVGSLEVLSLIAILCQILNVRSRNIRVEIKNWRKVTGGEVHFATNIAEQGS